jgi:hypothetical protein
MGKRIRIRLGRRYQEDENRTKVRKAIQKFRGREIFGQFQFVFIEPVGRLA